MLRKKIIFASVIFLLLAIIIQPIFVSTANAQSRKQTYAFIGALPNPAGIGQEVLLHVGITDSLGATHLGWEGLTVTVTKPDGTTQNLGPFKTDSTGGTGTTFIPTVAGNYTLQTHFPEQVNPVVTFFFAAGTIMEASDSDKLELLVGDVPVPVYPGSPLPTEYWTRPIDAQHREWYSIAGNWLESGSMLTSFPYNWPTRYAPYNDGPETAHILWAKPLTYGGLVGGNLGDNSMNVGDAYQGEFGSSVIINGVLYYNRYWIGFAGIPQQQGIIALDLRTGEELWFRNNTRLMFGQTFYWDSYNSHGTFAYIWGCAPPVYGAFVPITDWDAYDAFTGEWVYSMKNLPMGKMFYGPDGELYIVTVDNTNGWMSLWNSSRVVSLEGSWEPEGRIYANAGAAGLEWNVTIPTGLPGTLNFALSDRVIGSDTPAWTGLANKPITFWSLSLKEGQEGQLMFRETWTPPTGNLTMLPAIAREEEKLFIITAKEMRSLYGFSTETGKPMWGPSVTQPYLDIYTLGEERAISRAIVIAEGKVFSTGMGGVLHVLDAQTGKLLWNYTAVDQYSEILWSNNWPLRIAFITDGKIYICHDEHSPINPLPRGCPFVCLDIETGEVVWKIDGAFRQTEWGGTAIIGDSIIAMYNSYDQRIYALGKGPTATTVSLQDDVITDGDSVLLKGRVTDISAGTKDSGIATRFPDGVPAIADASMSDWMKHVYMQFPVPENASGVEVIIEVLDPNNNYYEVGRTTTDKDGFYKLMLEPEVPGEYTIVSKFAGSNAYWSSSAETGLGVTEAQSPPTPISSTASLADIYFLPMSIVLLVAIAIVGAIVVLILRKK